MKLEENSIVALDLKSPGSNTFYVDTDEGNTVLLTHPLMEKYVLIRVDKQMITNTIGANVKDSTERCIDYAKANRSMIDHNTGNDLEAIAMYFAIKRKLTPRQKQTISNICGMIAAIKFSDDIKEAMAFITKNSLLLDEFNAMWFNNFKGLFSGRQPITSKKQRDAIFNMAGYVLAELENPTTQARK